LSGRLRVVLDTNVLVSGLAYPGGVPTKILLLVQNGGLDVVLSRYILVELERVLSGLKRLRHLTSDDIQALVEQLALTVALVEPIRVDEAKLRDKADGPVLGTFLAAEADYLITGDKDLLVLAGAYPVVSPAEFWARYG
jgi:putative PIN family toxin of toxin-antitoxin system